MEESATISLYQNSIPNFVEAEMERLYQHMCSSFSHLKAYGGIADNTSTYVVRRNGEVTVVLLFRVEENKVLVLNQQIRLDEEEIDRFARHIFATNRFVNVISFPVIETD